MRTRIRAIKPEFFVNFKLDKLAKESGLPVHRVFSGLWVVADRDGRFEWLPHELQLNIMPYDDHSLFLDTLNALLSDGYIIRYEFVTSSYGYIPGWSKHQRPRADEAKSVIPSPGGEGVDIVDVSGVPSRVRNESVTNSRRGSGSGSGNGSKNPLTPRGGMGSLSKEEQIAEAVTKIWNEKFSTNRKANSSTVKAIRVALRSCPEATEDDFAAVVRDRVNERWVDPRKTLIPSLIRAKDFAGHVERVKESKGESDGILVF